MRDVGPAVFVGVLLAAGRGRRFDPDGRKSKLLQQLPDGSGTVAGRSARTLLASLGQVLAVVRTGDMLLAEEMRMCGCAVTDCGNADEGMAASLVHALSQSRAAQGWVVALADMPFVQESTISALAEAIAKGAQIAVPTYRGKRGNPVAFSRAYLPDLLALRGDAGARSLLERYPYEEVPVDDAGIRQDIDTLADLQTGLSSSR